MASRQARTTLVGFALLPFLHVRWWTGSPLLLLRISLPGLVGLAERFFVGFLATVGAGLFLAHRIPPFLPRPSVRRRNMRSSNPPSAKPATTSLVQCAKSRIRVAESASARARTTRRCIGGNRSAAEAKAPILTGCPGGEDTLSPPRNR